LKEIHSGAVKGWRSIKAAPMKRLSGPIPVSLIRLTRSSSRQGNDVIGGNETDQSATHRRSTVTRTATINKMTFSFLPSAQLTLDGRRSVIRRRARATAGGGPRGVEP